MTLSAVRHGLCGQGVLIYVQVACTKMSRHLNWLTLWVTQWIHDEAPVYVVVKNTLQRAHNNTLLKQGKFE